MKFKLKQEKMEELLEKLSIGGTFPSAIIGIKTDDRGEAMLFSAQREDHGRCYRFLKVQKSFFDELETPDGQEAIEIDVSRTLSAVKNILPGTELTVSVEGNKLRMLGYYEDKDESGNVIRKRKISPNITFKEPDSVDTKIPIQFNDAGIPVVGKDKVELDVKLSINLEDLKATIPYATTVKTDFYAFSLTKDKLELRIGNLHDFSDFWEFEPKYSLEKGTELSLVLTSSIKEVANTFRSDVKIMTKSNAPAWVYEKTDDYMLGLIIPPYITSDEEIL